MLEYRYDYTSFRSLLNHSGRPRILINTSTFPCDPNDGSPRFVYDLATHLSDHFDIVVVAPSPAREQSHSKVDVRHYPYFWPKRWQRLAYGAGMPNNLKESNLARLQVPFLIAAQTKALWQLVRRERIDLVNSHWIVPQGLCGAVVHQLTAVPHVVSIHSSGLNLIRRSRLGRRLGRSILKRTQACILVGEHQREGLDQLGGHHTPPSIRPMGVDLNLFKRDKPINLTQDRPAELLFVGRLIEIKGLRVLLDALPEILKEVPDVRLKVVGYGPLEDELRSQTQQLGLTEQVTFLGKKPHTDVMALMRHCVALVVPSIIDPKGASEGLPTVILEGLASGAAVVASDVGSIRHVVSDGHNGFLCEPGSVSKLARSLVQVLQMDRSTLTENALATAQQHGWNQVAEHYAQVFRSVLERHAKGPES